MAKIQIFLSYCWADAKIADSIFSRLEGNDNLELHRDILDIGEWGSIKEYMQSIGIMDFTILLISDAYLKSANCMYEVLEVIRDRNYKDKVFPAVINSAIYKPINRADYVAYWENEFKELKEKLNSLSLQNIGPLQEDLKICQDVSSNIAAFLQVVADMNNPRINDIAISIEEKLKEKGLLNDIPKQVAEESDLFTILGIKCSRFTTEPTDLEINQFVKESFEQVIDIFSRLCRQYEQGNASTTIEEEHLDKKTVIYKFYKNGTIVKGLKIFLSNAVGRRESIGVAEATMSWGNSNNSWNGMYEAKLDSEELKLFSAFGWGNCDAPMTSKEVVADIWKNHVLMYLERY